MFNKLKTWLCIKLCGCEDIDMIHPNVPKKGKSKGSGQDGTPKNRVNKGIVTSLTGTQKTDTD